MAELAYESLSGARKAAILLIALGVESSSAVFKTWAKGILKIFP